jgi:hypothetical protein
MAQRLGMIGRARMAMTRTSWRGVRDDMDYLMWLMVLDLEGRI